MIPVDTRRCQTEFREGPSAQTAFRFGPLEVSRCDKKPRWVAVEMEPNKKDGEIGAMSLCHECKGVCEKRVKGIRFMDLRSWRKWRDEQKEATKVADAIGKPEAEDPCLRCGHDYSDHNHGKLPVSGCKRPACNCFGFDADDETK